LFDAIDNVFWGRRAALIEANISRRIDNHYRPFNERYHPKNALYFFAVFPPGSLRIGNSSLCLVQYVRLLLAGAVLTPNTLASVSRSVVVSD